MKIFGYGTFITNEFFTQYTNVEPVYLPGFIRVLRPIDTFPYILRNIYDIKRNGFWGLAFDVSPKQLAELDYYEGSLYDRIEIECLLRNGKKIPVQTYYPTQNTIKNYNIADYIMERDLWQEKIIVDHPDICNKFPELGWRTGPKPI